MIQLAIALPAGCVIGWLIGAWLDRHFHQNWIGIVGILLGAVAGFMQIFRTASRYLKRGRDDAAGRWRALPTRTFRRTMLRALRLLAVVTVVAAPLLWWKLGWQSAVLLLVGAADLGVGAV